VPPQSAVDGARCASAILPIRGEDLVFERGGRRLLDHIDVEIGGGGTLVLIGPNGAGKSLLARVLAGLVTPTAGQLTWAGRAPDRRCAPRIGFVFQRPVLLRRSALANVEYALAIAGVARPVRGERARHALERARLAHLAHTPARVLSGGEQQLLAISRALMSRPRLMLLDEPTLGLAPMIALQMFELVRRLVEEGLTLLLAEQDVRRTLEVSAQAYVVENGRVVTEGAAAQLAEDPRIRQAYLGL